MGKASKGVPCIDKGWAGRAGRNLHGKEETYYGLPSAETRVGKGGTCRGSVTFKKRVGEYAGSPEQKGKGKHDARSIGEGRRMHLASGGG